jgi:hypothetical protein
MKSPTTLSTLALFLLCLALVPAAAAQSSKGFYDFTLVDGYQKHVEFDAQKLADGSTSGSMYFTDAATIVYLDVDGDGSPQEKYAGTFIKADLDDIVVNGNQAVMSGTVRDSSIPYLIGLRVLLTVEDNGDNTRIPDQLTWGVYKFIKKDWTPSDAEWDKDPGVGLTWWATDAEFRGDKGYQMPVPDAPAGTQSFPVVAYSFADTSNGTGDISVQP